MSNQPTLRDDYAQEGLPQADDYSPEALGTVQFSAGEPEQEWPQFGLELVPVMAESATQDDPVDTGRRMVMRNGKYLADVSQRYKLLPNERLVGVANGVADDLGAGAFHEFDGDWFIELDDHVFQDEEGRRVHAVYAWDTGEIDGDDMEYGFAVHNSIDGSLGFSVGLFTFRHACKNMVFMGTSSKAEQRALNVESEREVINQTSHSHTKGLDVDPEPLAATIKGTLTLIEDIDATYEEWVEEVVTPEDVAGLLNSGQIAQDDLSGWMQEIPDALEDVSEDETDEDEPLPWERQAQVIEAEIPYAKTVWETYMSDEDSLTANIWKSGESADNTRHGKMRDLHKVFNPVEAGSTDITVR